MPALGLSAAPPTEILGTLPPSFDPTAGHHRRKACGSSHGRAEAEGAQVIERPGYGKFCDNCLLLAVYAWILTAIQNLNQETSPWSVKALLP